MSATFAPGITPKFSDFKFLCFDVYGTLIDWETGFYQGLQPLLKKYPASASWTRQETLLAAEAIERDLEASQPNLRYADLLAKISATFEARLKAASESSITDSSSGSSATGATLEGELDASHIAFGQSVKDWPLFPDTYEALKRLSKYYKLCVLSNTDNQSFSKTLVTLSEGRVYSEFPVNIREAYKYPSPNPDKFWFPREAKGSNSPFTLIITAEAAGSYKPDPNGFEKIIETIRTDSRLLGDDASVEEAKSKLLWVAQSLYHDHETAQALGIHSVWINRQSAAMGMKESSKYNWTFHTLGEMADAVEAEFGQSA